MVGGDGGGAVVGGGGGGVVAGGGGGALVVVGLAGGSKFTTFVEVYARSAQEPQIVDGINDVDDN